MTWRFAVLARQLSGPHPYLAPIGPGTEIGRILDLTHPSNPGPIEEAQCVNACRNFAEGLPDNTPWRKANLAQIPVRPNQSLFARFESLFGKINSLFCLVELSSNSLKTAMNAASLHFESGIISVEFNRS